MTTTPNHETAKLIRAYAEAILTECMGYHEETDLDSAYDYLLDAIMLTAAATIPAEACCHMGRALLCIEDGLSDPPYRLGGEMCDPRKMEIARRLGMVEKEPAYPCTLEIYRLYGEKAFPHKQTTFHADTSKASMLKTLADVRDGLSDGFGASLVDAKGHNVR